MHGTLFTTAFPKSFEGIGKLKDHEQKIDIHKDILPVAQTYRRVASTFSLTKAT
jgi:hypothetical protein